MTNAFQFFLALCIGHAIADYPLQGDFLAKAKNHKEPLPGIDWRCALLMHSLIHCGFVWVITGSYQLGVMELIFHTFIDWAKCEGTTNFRQDQLMHIACKAVWVVICVMGVS